MTDEGIRTFEESAAEYEAWFETHGWAYESELLALREFIRPHRPSLEIGVGTGRFAAPLGIEIGVEPAKKVAELARQRGITVIRAVGEYLPFCRDSFHQVLLVTVLCFLRNPLQGLAEARRVLKPGGRIVIGMIDRDSPLGQLYEAWKPQSRFYRHANFYSVSQVWEWLESFGYMNVEVCQTLFGGLEAKTHPESVRAGHGEGGFAVIAAQKRGT